jgi:cyclophilin family peptidyl-prolyl cis-trans isomerase
MLISEGLRVDVFGMRSKLSQTSPRSGAPRHAASQPATLRGRRRTALLLFALGGLALLDVAAGCNRVDADGGSPIGAPSSEASGRAVLDSRAVPSTTALANASSGEDFVWPEDPSHPRLTIEIEAPGTTGRIEIELMPELAPESVAHVLARAREGDYDGTTFHRVIPGFMIQGGDPKSRDRDPTNDGRGGLDVRIVDEPSEAPFVRGVVALANRGRPDTSGSQFFIMHADTPALAGDYNVIGRVRSGMVVVDAIAEVDRDEFGRWGPKDRPIENVVMARVACDGGPGTGG